MLTSFLDGREAAVAERLRDRSSQRGLLAVNHNFTDRGREYMPFGPMRKEPCLKASGAARIPCFLASELGAFTSNLESGADSSTSSSSLL